MANDIGGVWRTIGGRRVFIKDGQDLASAMKESGKFKSNQKVRDSIKKIGDTDINALRNLSQRVKEKNNKMVSDYQNGVIDRDELMKRFDGNEEEMIKAFEKMGYTAPTKENIDKANKRHEEFMNNLKSKEEKTLEEQYAEDLHNGKTKGTFQQWRDKKEGKEPTTQAEINNLERIGERKVSVQNSNDKETKSNNWRDEVKKNNEQLEKDLKKYQETHDMARENEGYYELFRENERRNAKIKQESPEEPYEFVEAYAGYRDKSYKLAGTKENGKEIEEYGTKSWSGKEYTNDEFMEHLEDSNWHSERKQLLDANLTNQELAYIKDHTTLSQWSVGEELTGKENTQKLIDEAKAKFSKTSERDERPNRIFNAERDLKIGDTYIDGSGNLNVVVDRPSNEGNMAQRKLTKLFVPGQKDIKGTRWEVKKIRSASKEDYDKYPSVGNYGNYEKNKREDWVRKAFDEYKKKHPNSRLNFSNFKDNNKS